MTWVCCAHAAGAQSITASVVARNRRNICMSCLLKSHDGRTLRPVASIFCAHPRTEQLLEFLGMWCTRDRLAPLDEPLPDQVGERFLEGEGAVFAGDCDLLMQVLQGVLPHVLPRPVAHHQQLRCR